MQPLPVDRPRTPRWLLLVLPALLLWAWAPLLFGGQALYYQDLSHYVYPLQQLAAEAYRQGELPLWNPWVHLGCPLAGHGDQALFYPGFAMFLFASPAAVYPLYLMLHHLWAALGMGLFLRAHGRSGGASMLGGIGFGLCGVLVSSHVFPRFVVGAAWLPWVLLGLAWALQGERRWLGLSGLALGMQILGGGTETAYLSGLLVGLYGLCVRDARPARTRVRDLLRRALWLPLLIAAIGLCVAAVQLLPFLDYAWSTARSAGTGSEELAWALHPLRSLELVAPDLFGRLAPERSFSAAALLGPLENSPWHATIYAGAPLVWLAFWGALSKRDACQRFLLWAALLGFLLATGGFTPLGPWLRRLLPGVGLFRFAEKFLIGLSFALPALAAWGADALWQAGPRRKKRILLSAVLGALAIAGLPLLSGLEWIWSGASPRVAGAALALLVAGLLFLPRRSTGVVLALLLVVGADLAWQTRSHLYAVPREDFPAQLWGAEALTAHARQQPAERFNRRPPRAPFPLPAQVSRVGAPRFFHQLQGLFMDACIGKAYRLDGLGPGPTQRWSAFFAALREQPARVRRLLNVRFCLTSRELPAPAGGRLLAEDPALQLALYELPHGPRAWLCQRVTWLPDEPAVLERLGAVGFEPGRTLLLVDGGKSGESRTGLDSGHVRVTVYEPQRVELEVETASGGYVVLADAWDAGWRAEVGGSPAEVLLADALLRAVEVPAGRSRVVLRYSPPGVWWGMLVSGLSLLALAGVAAFKRWGRGGKPPPL